MYEVRVKDEWQHSTAQVAGRIFSKAGVEYIHEHEMTDEIRNSPVLDVVDLEAKKKKAAARAKARKEAKAKAEAEAKAKAEAEAKAKAKDEPEPEKPKQRRVGGE